jgi:hypothetical protein
MGWLLEREDTCGGGMTCLKDYAFKMMFFAEKEISFFLVEWNPSALLHCISTHYMKIYHFTQSREVCFNSNSLDQYSNMEEFVIIQEKKGINLLFSK